MRRPTGTDDDMGGNDKLTTSRDLDRTGTGGVQRTLVLKPGQFDPVLTFYDTSGAGMHLPGTGKTGGVALWRHPVQPPGEAR
jgi:hypothetical protein